jgi:2-polyprenyl-3-methyl-5-hydroxy-6-metoxy-1,4-benzoquinol methylase
MVVMKARQLEPEIMDDPGLEAGRHHAALRGLARLNRVSGAASLVWPLIASLARAAAPANRSIRVLDIATGGGDLPIAIRRCARKVGLDVTVDGCDISDTALAYAESRADEARVTGCRFFQLNALTEPLPDGYDVIICSLFLHHLERDEAVHLLGQMRRHAGRRIIINDLSRGRMNLAMVFLGSRLVTRSPVVHVDAIRSVRAAWTPGELRGLAEEAQLTGAKLRSVFPSRMLLHWDRPS